MNAPFFVLEYKRVPWLALQVNQERYSTKDSNCSVSDDSVCELRSMVIAEWYDISSYDKTTSVQNCYSNWKFPKDITRSVVSVQTSTSWSGGPGIKAVDGIYLWDRNYVFLQFSRDKNPLAKFDFGSPQTFSKIVMKKITGRNSDFNQVTIEMSLNSDGPWTLFYYYGSENSPGGTVLHFCGQNGPVKGRFVRFTAPTRFSIPELAFIST